MTTYRVIAGTETDPDSPVTSTLVIAMADNPTAIAEGTSTTGTPVNTAAWAPFDMVTLDDGAVGTIWKFDDDGAVEEFDSPDLQNEFEYMFFFDNVEIDTVSSVRLDAFLDDPAVLQLISNISTATPGVAFEGMLRLVMPRVRTKTHQMVTEMKFFTETGSAFTVSIQETFNTNNSKIGHIRFYLSAGGGALFTAGEIKMFRRRLFVLF